MVSGMQKLLEARKIILDNLKGILLSELIPERYEIRFVLNNGIKVFIRYNDFNKYGYQIVFSGKKEDRIRFDNYDEKWQVDTHPHHYHPRNKSEGINSDMKGIPVHDIPLLIDNINNV